MLLVVDGGGTAAISDAHTHCSPVVDEDVVDVLAQADLTSVCADPLLDHARDLPASAAGEPRAVHVVAHDHRVGDERAASGLDPVVAPMRGEEGAQGRVAEAALHVVLCPFQGASCPQAEREVNGGGCKWWDHLGHVAQRHPRIGARHVSAVASNGSLLAWKQGDQEALVLLDTGWDCDGQAVAGQDETVVARGHSIPAERAAGQVVEELAWAGSQVHVADVVQSDIPGSAHPTE